MTDSFWQEVWQFTTVFPRTRELVFFFVPRSRHIVSRLQFDRKTVVCSLCITTLPYPSTPYSLSSLRRKQHKTTPTIRQHRKKIKFSTISVHLHRQLHLIFFLKNSNISGTKLFGELAWKIIRSAEYSNISSVGICLAWKLYPKRIFKTDRQTDKRVSNTIFCINFVWENFPKSSICDAMQCTWHLTAL